MNSVVQKYIALIPARSNSKSIKNKNIQNFNGLPLFVHSIEVARKVKEISQIVVSTDSKVYADIARHHGAEVPFLRPLKYSNDLSRDEEFIRHYIQFNGSRSKEPRPIEFVIVLLRPTHPIRSSTFITEAINEAKKNVSCLIKSLSPATESPYKMWQFSNSYEVEGQIEKILGTYEDDNHNSPRQELPQVFWQDGYLDIVRICAFNNPCSLHDARVQGIVSPSHVKDIDYIEDFVKAAEISKAQDDLAIHPDRILESIDCKRYSS